MRSTKLLVPSQVSESVCVAPVPRYAEQSSVSFIDFITMKRFNEEVNLTPCLTPVGYRDTIICWKDSTRKKFKSETVYEPKIKPKKFQDTLIVYPKRPQKGYVTFLDYHIDECRRWFRTSMEFKARTYTTTKLIGEKSDDVSDVQVVKDRDVNDNFAGVSDGPGASQIFLPRWNKDGLEPRDKSQNQYPMVNGDINIMNGF